MTRGARWRHARRAPSMSATYSSALATTSIRAHARTLAQLRPWALMLVVASAEEYVADMLGALRA